ncbi:MAG: hypothetical protein LBK60_06505 [Verrucomicrobiales bacterium]|nr:hypothetical protein [Verrucomicrobiales bacterium]
MTRADELDTVTAFLPLRKRHPQPRPLTLRQVEKAHRYLATEYPSMFAETKDDGSVKLRHGKPVPDRLAIDAFMGFLHDVRARCPAGEERAVEAQKFADAAKAITDRHYLQAQLAQYQPQTSAGGWRGFFRDAKRRRELWTVTKDEKGVPILNEQHQLILRRVDPYGEEFWGGVKRLGSELVGHFGHKDITDPCARSLLGVLNAGGYLLKKAGLVKDASMARGESVLARDIEELGKAQAAQALVKSLDGRANPNGVLATLGETIHLHRKSKTELDAIIARRAAIVPYKTGDKV